MTVLGHPDHDAWRSGPERWDDAGSYALSVQCDAIADAEAHDELVVPCPGHRCHTLGCARCHGAGWLTQSQATPAEVAAAAAIVRADAEDDDDTEEV